MIHKARIIRIGILFSLFNLALTAAVGVLLRYHKVMPVRWLNERYWIHGHSHTGFLGWMFIALITTAFALQMPDKPSLNKKVFTILLGLQFCVLGMFTTFPFTGYALFSILFSTMHMALAAILFSLYFRHTLSHRTAVRLMRTAMVFFLLSGLGPLALGPLVVLGKQGSAWYEMAVYYYLHFQYNGWFVFAILSFTVHHLEKSGIEWDRQRFLIASKALLISVFLTYTLSVYGITTHGGVVFLGVSGAAIQSIATIFLTILLFTSYKQNLQLTSWTKWLFLMALAAWNIKTALQLFSAIPRFTTLIYTNREMIMMYLHLMFLGVATCFLFGLWIHQNRLDIRKLSTRTGIALLLTGILSTELLIGFRSFPKYMSYESYLTVNISLLIASSVLFVSVLVILAGNFNQLNKWLKHQHQTEEMV